MKNNFYVEFNNNQVLADDIIKKLKEAWVASGNKIKDIKETDIYYKLEENTAYCIVNKTEKINIVL